MNKYDINEKSKDLELSPDVIKEFSLDFLNECSDQMEQLHYFIKKGDETNVKNIVLILLKKSQNLRFEVISKLLGQLLDGNSITFNLKIYDELINYIKHYTLDIITQEGKVLCVIEDIIKDELNEESDDLGSVFVYLEEILKNQKTETEVLELLVYVLESNPTIGIKLLEYVKKINPKFNNILLQLNYCSKDIKERFIKALVKENRL